MNAEFRRIEHENESGVRKSSENWSCKRASQPAIIALFGKTAKNAERPRITTSKTSGFFGLV
mgnify:CR=1 FL=1